MKRVMWMLAVVAAFSVDRAQAQDLDLNDDEAIRRMDLDDGEQRKAEEANLRKTPPVTVVDLNFDHEDPKNRHSSHGWGIGWGGRKKLQWDIVPGYGDKGGALLINVQAIAGFPLQLWYGGMRLAKGCWYKFQIKVKGFDCPSTFHFGARQLPAPWGTYGIGGMDIKPTNEWREYVGYYQATDSENVSVWIETGSPGCFAIDELKVEQFIYDPRPPAPPFKSNPVVEGNLIPQPSCETAHTTFWADSILSGNVDSDWEDPRFSRVGEAHEGRFAMRLPAQKKGGNRLAVESRAIPVATNEPYSFSCWAKTPETDADLTLTILCGKEVKSSRVVLNGGEWKPASVTMKMPNYAREVSLKIESGGREIWIDSLRFACGKLSRKQTCQPSYPYELDLVMDVPEPRQTPKLVNWGEKIPLRVAAYPAGAEPSDAVIKATLKVWGWPFKEVLSLPLELKAGVEQHLKIDPPCEGLFRFKLIPDDTALAAVAENIFARIPPQRGYGIEGGMGGHLRTTPFNADYYSRIGLCWERNHDCTPITNQGWGNPKKGEYRWADDVIDGFLAKGIHFLGMPDYPGSALTITNIVRRQKAQPTKATEKADMDKAINGKVATDSLADFADEEMMKNLARRTAAAQDKVTTDKDVRIIDVDMMYDWCKAAAEHYKGRIDHWEVWNEPYMDYFFDWRGNDFMKVFRSCAKGLRDGNPDAKVGGWCCVFDPCYVNWVNGWAKKTPVEEKPDFNTTHFYHNCLPADGQLGIEETVKGLTDLGDRSSGVLWNTEGNMRGGSPSFYSHRFNDEGAANELAVGVRIWSDCFFDGIRRQFLYMQFNCDGPNGGCDLADFDRSPNFRAVGTAMCGYYVDTLDPVRDIEFPVGIKLRTFQGKGRTVVLIFDDLVELGYPTFDPAKIPAGCIVKDSSGTDMKEKRSLVRAPYFIVSEKIGPRELAAAVIAATNIKPRE